MRNILFCLLILLSSLHAMAQDKIYLIDNSVIEAKISEISLTDVKYKKWNNLTGPDYVMPKTEIALIVYANGTHEVINRANEEVKTDETIDILPYYSGGKNYIGINYFDLIFKNITFNYTRYLLNYKLSVGLSGSFGFTYSDSPYEYSSSFLGFDRDYFHSQAAINYFPVGMNKVSYFTGLSLMAGIGAEYNYDYWGPYVLTNKTYYGFYVNNGVQFNITKSFNLRTSLSLGLVDRDMNGDFYTHGLFELAAGLRF